MGWGGRRLGQSPTAASRSSLMEAKVCQLALHPARCHAMATAWVEGLARYRTMGIRGEDGIFIAPRRFVRDYAQPRALSTASMVAGTWRT